MSRSVLECGAQEHRFEQVCDDEISHCVARSLMANHLLKEPLFQQMDNDTVKVCSRFILL